MPATARAGSLAQRHIFSASQRRTPVSSSPACMPFFRLPQYTGMAGLCHTAFMTARMGMALLDDEFLDSTRCVINSEWMNLG